MKVTWRVSDGYANPGPQTCTIDDEDILACDSGEEVLQLVEECVKEDFSQTVSFSYDEDEVRSQAALLFKKAEA